MIQSPCRHCPNRFKAKRLCMDSCILLQQVQSLAVARREPEPYSAVNMADDNRYRLMNATETRRNGMRIYEQVY